jgi:hypothetical protein
VTAHTQGYNLIDPTNLKPSFTIYLSIYTLPNHTISNLVRCFSTGSSVCKYVHVLVPYGSDSPLCVGTFSHIILAALRATVLALSTLCCYSELRHPSLRTGSTSSSCNPYTNVEAPDFPLQGHSSPLVDVRIAHLLSIESGLSTCYKA